MEFDQMYLLVLLAASWVCKNNVSHSNSAACRLAFISVAQTSDLTAALTAPAAVPTDPVVVLTAPAAVPTNPAAVPTAPAAVTH